MTNETTENSAQLYDFETAFKTANSLINNLSTVIFGANKAIRASVLACLSGKHLLLEDTPGVGKTVLAKAMAHSLGVKASRIQGQPDLLPSDITGFSIYRQELGKFEFQPGPIFSQIVLCDELNRTPPRTQAALLETMEEKQVTVDGTTHTLPEPHLIVATQNPISQYGTFPLVESQVDRFGIATSLGYPKFDEEVQLMLNGASDTKASSIEQITTPDGWRTLKEITSKVQVSEKIADYVVRIISLTRNFNGIKLGASPRAGLSLLEVCRAEALIQGRTYIIPDDVLNCLELSIGHRLVLEPGIKVNEILWSLIQRVNTPLP